MNFVKIINFFRYSFPVFILSTWMVSTGKVDFIRLQKKFVVSLICSYSLNSTKITI